MNTGRKTPPPLYHFIGKDIVYFHSLFWPAMLEGSNFRKSHQPVCSWLCDGERRKDVQFCESLLKPAPG
ncbi:class I tRNA ligase family protein [Escherichia coli]